MVGGMPVQQMNVHPHVPQAQTSSGNSSAMERQELNIVHKHTHYHMNDPSHSSTNPPHFNINKVENLTMNPSFLSGVEQSENPGAPQPSLQQSSNLPSLALPPPHSLHMPHQPSAQYTGENQVPMGCQPPFQYSGPQQQMSEASELTQAVTADQSRTSKQIYSLPF